MNSFAFPDKFVKKINVDLISNDMSIEEARNVLGKVAESLSDE